MPNILLIEDNPGDARLIQEMLRELSTLSKDYKIQHVERVKDAVKILGAGSSIDIVLSDITLPDSQGVETLETINAAAGDLPVLFMTGTNDEALAVTALQQGAQDYLIKGLLNPFSLSRALEYSMGRKKSQNELAKARSEARSSRERVELLAQQKKNLIEVNRSKDEFVSIASHQLRTPATVVKQYLGMVLEGFLGDVDERQLEVLRIAYDSNERQLDVINELLKTARLDSRRVLLDIQQTDITAMISEIIKNQKPIIDMRKQTVEYAPDRAYSAHVDPEEFHLVVENVIENASKYTPPGKTIRISVTEEKTKLCILVSDEGVGIPKADQKKIFEKFTRVDNELSDTVSGTGLGLYWAKKILRLHKGNITVASTPGKGSTFTISLPL